MEQEPPAPQPSDMQRRGEAFGAWLGYVGVDRSSRAARTFEAAYQGHYENMRAYTIHRLGALGAKAIIDNAYATLPREVSPYLYFDIDSYESRIPVFTPPSEFGGIMVFDEMAYPQER